MRCASLLRILYIQGDRGYLGSEGSYGGKVMRRPVVDPRSRLASELLALDFPKKVLQGSKVEASHLLVEG